MVTFSGNHFLHVILIYMTAANVLPPDAADFTADCILTLKMYLRACVLSFRADTKNVGQRIPRLCTRLWKALRKTMRRQAHVYAWTVALYLALFEFSRFGTQDRSETLQFLEMSCQMGVHLTVWKFVPLHSNNHGAKLHINYHSTKWFQNYLPTFDFSMEIPYFDNVSDKFMEHLY